VLNNGDVVLLFLVSDSSKDLIQSSKDILMVEDCVSFLLLKLHDHSVPKRPEVLLILWLLADLFLKRFTFVGELKVGF
jgi:hypothetical protein